MSVESVPQVATTTRPRAAGRLFLGAAALGVLADQLLRDGRWGVGLLIWMATFAAVVVILVHRLQRRLSLESACWLAVAVVFAGGLSWRDAELLQLFDVMAMLAALVLLALSLNALPVPGLAAARLRDLLDAAFGTGVDVVVGFVPLLAWALESRAELTRAKDGQTGRRVRALLLTVPILVLFTVLLVQADPLFGAIVKLPEVNFELVFSHILITGFFTWVVAGWLRRAFMGRAGASVVEPALPFSLGSTDVLYALGALNILFATFVLVQVGWLFGGEALVLRTTGLGYAQYARRGFFELAWVAALLLPLLLAAQAMIPAAEHRVLRLYRRLAVPLVLLLGAILVSAAARMRLYVLYYGLSTDRIYAMTFMAWLAIVFGWFTWTVLRSRPRLFAAGMMVSGFVMLLALNCLNPDGLVARTNLARDGSHSSAAGPDLGYVASLGGDAVPALITALTATTAPTDSATSAARCAAADRLIQHWTGDGTPQRWTEWSVARARARAAVETHLDQLRALSCPKPAPLVTPTPGAS